MQKLFSQEQLCKKIIATLGEKLTEQELQSCLKGVEIIEPLVAKLFWQATVAKPGIYIVLGGKARLVDGLDNLVATVSRGACFGEQSLFGEQDFLFLAARASTSLKVCFINGEVLHGLMEKYPQIPERLWRRAEFWDVLLLCRQNSQLSRGWFTEEIFKALCLFERYSIEPGGSTSKLFEDNQLLVLRQGELKNTANQTLIPGNFYTETDTDSNGKWEVREATIAYSLKSSNLQLALQEWNELVTWINPSEQFSQKQVRSRNFRNKVFPKTEGVAKDRKIIPLPSSSSQKEKTKPYFPSPKIKAKHIWERLSKQYAFYAQQSGSDCGCAPLVMIARHSGKRLAVNRMRDIANVNRNGRSLRSLAAAAESIGFVRKPVKASSLLLSYFESRYVGDITSRIQENGKIQSFLSGETLSIVLDLIRIVVYLAVMFWYNWQLSLLVLLIVPPFFILALASTSILRKMSREIFNACAEQSSYLTSKYGFNSPAQSGASIGLGIIPHRNSSQLRLFLLASTSVLIQSLTGIRSVGSMAIEHTMRWKWEELLNNAIKKSFGAKIIGSRLQIISGSIDRVASTGLLWFGAYLLIDKQLTIGQLIAFKMLKGNVISPFKRLSGVWNQFQEIMISTKRINDVLEAEENLLASPRRHISKLRGHIRFDNVTFRYHPESETKVLENLSFEIQPEQMIAILGCSGSGKTTLLKLILGLYPRTDGKVLIDGHDVSKISLKSLDRQIGVVNQNTFLFGGTIRENISVAHLEASIEEIMEAGRLARADEFIQKQPMSYETQIGEGGGMLSGGQRQRLVIACALLGNPQLLIFDEATSSLDAETERIIQNN